MYTGESFQLDGRMDLDITFGDTTIHTTVYLKMDVQEQIFL